MFLKKILYNFLKCFLLFYIIYYLIKFYFIKNQMKLFKIKGISNDDLIHPKEAYIFGYLSLDNNQKLLKVINNIKNIIIKDRNINALAIDKPINNVYDQTKSIVIYYPNYQNNKLLILFQHRYFDGKTISKILSEGISENSAHDRVKQIKYRYYPFWEEFNVIKVLSKYFTCKSTLFSGTEKYHRFNRFYSKSYDSMYQKRKNLNAKMSILIAWETLQQAHLYSEKDLLNVLVITALTSNNVPSNNQVTFFFIQSKINESYSQFENRFKKSAYILNTISGLVEMGLLHKLPADGKIDVNLSILPPDIIKNENFVGCTERLLPISIFTFSTKNKVSYTIQINCKNINPDKVDQVLYSNNKYNIEYKEIEDLMNIFDNITPYPEHLYSGRYKQLDCNQKQDENKDKNLDMKNNYSTQDNKEKISNLENKNMIIETNISDNLNKIQDKEKINEESIINEKPIIDNLHIIEDKEKISEEQIINNFHIIEDKEKISEEPIIDNLHIIEEKKIIEDDKCKLISKENNKSETKKKNKIKYNSYKKTNLDKNILDDIKDNFKSYIDPNINVKEEVKNELKL